VFALFINIFVDSPAAVETLVQLGIRILSQTGKAFIIEQPVVCRQLLCLLTPWHRRPSCTTPRVLNSATQSYQHRNTKKQLPQHE
jgi:hypothetical protein